MANEFVIKKGYKSLDNSEITGSLTTTGDITINGGNLDISSTMSSSPTSIIYLDISGTNVDGGGGSIVFDTSATGGSLTNYNAQIRGVRASGGNGGDSQLEFWTTLVSDQTAPKRRAYFTKTGHFYPGLDSTYNIGSNTERFANIYADNLYGDGSNLTNVTASETDTLDSVTDRGSTTTNSITTGDITIQDATPVLVLKDSNNSGGGAAHARILFSNTGGKAIAIGTTGDDDTSTDLYISSNAGSTYGGYLLLDSAGISDAQADIIIDPKTNFKVFTAATEALTINTSQNATFAGVIHTTKDGGAVAAISTPRIRLRTDGVIDWGATYNAGQLTWDSDYAFVNGLSGKGLKFGTNGSTLALTLDTSQNATFQGNVSMVTGNSTGKFAVMSTGVHASYDFYNNGTSYFNDAVTVDGTFTQSGGGASTFSGDVTVAGKVTAQEFHTEFVSASIMYESGSTKFGDTSDDNHDFTGSLNLLNGSLSITGPGTEKIRIHNSTNGGGAAIVFNDVAAGDSQDGAITYKHTDSTSQGGGAAFHFTGEPDLTLVLGDGTYKGRFVASSQGSDTEVDYGFYDDVNTGMVRTSADNVSLVAGGVRGIGVGTTAISLKYAGSTKLATSNTGVTVTGDIDADDITINDWGSVSASLSSIQTAGGVNGTGSTNRLAIWSDTDTLTSDAGLSYANDTLNISDANYTSISIDSDVAHHSTISFLSSSFNVGRIGWHKQGYYASSAMGVNPSPAMLLNAPNGLDFAHNSTGSLSIKSGSADVIIDERVNLGIGVASPGYKLEVDGTTRIHNRLTFGGNVNNFIEGTGSSLDFKSNGEYYFKKGANTQLTILSGGNVGIGTTSPDQKLQVEFANSDTSFSGGSGGDWGSEGIRIENTVDTVDTMAMLHLRNNDADIHIAGIRQGTDDSDLGLFFEGTEKVRFKNNGNVGIGTDSPAGKLHVYGGRSYFAPQGASNSGVNSHAAVFYNPHDSAFTANALAAYNAHTSWDIESKSTFTISPRTKDASIYTYAGEHATANAALNRYVQFNSNNTNAIHQWNFYQYDGTGTASTDLKKPGTLWRVSSYDLGVSTQKLILSGDGDLTITGDLDSSDVTIDGWGSVSASLASIGTDNNDIDYINAAAWSASTGVLSLTGVGNAGATVDLDDRYPTFRSHVLQLSNGELANFNGSMQMLVDANDSGTDVSTHGDFAGGHPYGIYFTGDNDSATTTLGNGLVKVWHTGHFKKQHIDYLHAISSSLVTSTEFGYLDGVTSNIQTQLNNKLENTTDNFTGNLNILGGNNNSKESFINVKRGNASGEWLKFQTDSTTSNNVSQFVIRKNSDSTDLISINTSNNATTFAGNINLGRNLEFDDATGGINLITSATELNIGPTNSAHNVTGFANVIYAGSPVAGTTNNIAGGHLYLAGGQGKGTGAGGDIIFRVAPVGSSSSTVNAYETALTISDDKSATFAGDVEASSYFADTHFRSTDSNATLSATGGGGVYLRPDGYNQSTSQAVIAANGGDATFAGTVTAATSFISDAIGSSNNDPGSDNAQFNGYGVIGHRGALYLTNAETDSSATVQIGVGGAHNVAPKLIVGTTNSTFYTNVVPQADSTYNLGSNSLRWTNLYADNLYGDGSNITNISYTETDTLDSVVERDSVTDNTITINGLKTNTDSTYDIGQNATRFLNGYFDNLHVKDKLQNNTAAYINYISNQGHRFYVDANNDDTTHKFEILSNTTTYDTNNVVVSINQSGDAIFDGDITANGVTLTGNQTDFVSKANGGTFSGPITINTNSTPGLIVKSSGNTGQDQILVVRGSRNAPSAGVEPAKIQLQSYDDDDDANIVGGEFYMEATSETGTGLTDFEVGIRYRKDGSIIDGFKIHDGEAVVNGNLTVAGKLTAQEFHTEFVSASIMYESGSTKFGDTSDDIHSFTGSVNIDGTLTATVKSFDIVHPTQEGKRLVYGVLEGPEHAVYVRGESKEDTVILPEEWKGLVDKDTLTVQLTPIGSPDIYYYKNYENNSIIVGGPEKKHYFYYVQATRKDVEPLITVQ